MSKLLTRPSEPPTKKTPAIKAVDSWSKTHKYVPSQTLYYNFGNYDGCSVKHVHSTSNEIWLVADHMAMYTTHQHLITNCAMMTANGTSVSCLNAGAQGAECGQTQP